jgi:hypothetical protein
MLEYKIKYIEGTTELIFVDLIETAYSNLNARTMFGYVRTISDHNVYTTDLQLMVNLEKSFILKQQNQL